MRDPKSRSRFKTTAKAGLTPVDSVMVNPPPPLADHRRLIPRVSASPPLGTYATIDLGFPGYRQNRIASLHRRCGVQERSRGKNEGRKRVRAAASSRLHDSHR